MTPQGNPAESSGGSARPSVAIVTGAARGIGLAIARRLGQDDWTVVLADLDGAEASAATLKGEGISATGVTLDVTDSERVADVVAVIERDVGPIDALVNNAGILRDGRLADMTDADFRAVIDVCLFGAFYMSRSVAPAMMERGSGRIVNITSRAYLGNPGQANYSAAKAGLVGLTKALAKELGRGGVTVNAVAPGMVETDLVRAHPKFDAIVERAKKASSVARIGQPEDVAEAVSYLCSSLAGYITGDVLHVTGGRFG